MERKMLFYFSLVMFELCLVALSNEMNSVSENEYLGYMKNETLEGSLSLGEASINSSFHETLDVVTNQENIYMNSTSNTLQNGSTNINSQFLKALQSIWLFDGFLAEAKALLFTTSRVAMIETFPQRLPEDVPESARTCSVDISSVILTARQKVEWALEMIDATGSPGSGILKGNIRYLGDFDECMKVDTNVHFDSRYCLTNIAIVKIQDIFLSTPSIFSLGLCVPSSCGVEELEIVINSYLLSRRPDVIAGVAESKCHDRSPSLTWNAKLTIITCSMLVMVIVIATTYDVLNEHQWSQKTGSDIIDTSSKTKDAISVRNASELKTNKSERDPINSMESQPARSYTNTNGNSQKKLSKMDKCKELLMPFSAYTNLSGLLNTRPDSNSIDCIQGIRFISTTWIILVHMISIGLLSSDNIKGYPEVAADRWTFSAIIKGELAVDTFFSIGGLLTAYLTLKKLTKNEASIGFFGNLYIDRYFRLTPVYLMILMNVPIMTRYMYNGPTWDQSGMQYDICKKDWWANMLYVNNFIKENKCMGWTWYLANDMQFYIASPLIILPMFIYEWQGLVVPFVFILASAICSGVITSSYDLGVTPGNGHLKDFPTKYYDKPYTRMGPYVVGMMTGFLLYKYGRKDLLSKWLVVFGWLGATAVALAAVYGAHDVVNEPMSTSMAALYNALHRIGWSMSISWVIYACANGYGGFINTFLSWKAFHPLSHLSYSAYLIHPFLIVLYYTSQRNMYHFNTFGLMYIFPGIIAFTYACALIAYLAFEVPLTLLAKIFKRDVQKIFKKD